LSRDEALSAVEMYKTFNEIFMIIDFSILEDSAEEIPQDILQKLEDRNVAKSDKDFDVADSLRDEIEAA
jgi:cysteinyl-tRNA synthetase